MEMKFLIKKDGSGRPLIFIPKSIWESILEAARETKGKEIFKAYFVYDAKLDEEGQTHGEFIEAGLKVE